MSLSEWNKKKYYDMLKQASYALGLTVIVIPEDFDDKPTVIHCGFKDIRLERKTVVGEMDLVEPIRKSLDSRLRRRNIAATSERV